MRKYIAIILLIFFLIPVNIYAASQENNNMEIKTDNIYENSNISQKEKNIDQELIENNEKVYKAVIIDTIEKSKRDELGNFSEIVRVRFLNGPDKNKEENIEYYYDEALNIKLNLNPGSKVLVSQNKTASGSALYSIVDNYRINYLIYLGIAFSLILIIIGGLKGIRTLISILLTVIILFFVAIPLIIKGYNSIAIAIISSIVILVLNTIIACGYNKKAISTIIGTSSGVIIAGAIAYYIGKEVNLRGISMDESQMLFALKDIIKFSPEGILFTGIIWGTLGAVMDVGMSISSSINEIKIANPDYRFKDLFKSGIVIGRDIMSTMSNTLILAYFGSSLPLILLILISNENIMKVVNMDFIATEIVRSLAGSIGLILTIPITAFIAATMISKNKKISEIED